MQCIKVVSFTNKLVLPVLCFLLITSFLILCY